MGIPSPLVKCIYYLTLMPCFIYKKTSLENKYFIIFMGVGEIFKVIYRQHSNRAFSYSSWEEQKQSTSGLDRKGGCREWGDRADGRGVVLVLTDGNMRATSVPVGLGAHL